MSSELGLRIGYSEIMVVKKVVNFTDLEGLKNMKFLQNSSSASARAGDSS